MIQRKKMLIFGSYPAPYRVGVFNLLASRYEADVFFAGGKDTLDKGRPDAFYDTKSAEYHLLDKFDDLLFFKQCLKNLHQYDIVLVYDYSSVNAAKLMLACIKNKIPYIINCDGGFVSRHIVKDKIKKYWITHATCLFASGECAKEYFLAYGAKEEQIYYHNFTSLWSSDILPRGLNEDEKKLKKQQLGFCVDCKLVVAVGQFIHRKGFDILLEAWNQITSNEAVLCIIGGGELKEQYNAYIQSNELKNVVLKDFMSKQELYQFYKAADLFVLPTREDIWGLVINEAMSCGLPFVTTEKCISGVELQKKAKCGVIVPNEDAQSLTKEIETLLYNDALREEMAIQALELIKYYTIENVVISHASAIDEILKS